MRSESAIPRNLQALVDRELASGERLVWIDRPLPRCFTPAATAAFLFAIPWTAFALFWTWGAAGFQVPDFKGEAGLFPMFGVPFILIGVGLLSSPLVAYGKALKTVYVITDQRAITFDGGWSTTIRSYPPDKLTDVYRKEKRDGSGDVVIVREAWKGSEGEGQMEELGFLRIANPKQIEGLLKQLAAQGEGPNRSTCSGLD